MTTINVVDKLGINPKRQKDLKRVTAVAETVAGVLGELPSNRDMVAGYLQAYTKGDYSSKGNALAKFLELRKPVDYKYLFSSDPWSAEKPEDAAIRVGGRHVFVELGDFSAEIELTGEVREFQRVYLNCGYPSLISGALKK